MPQAKRQKRRAMFMKGAAAYQAWSGGSESVYACPICQRELPEAALASGDLTLEDVPPKSRGGGPLALTCGSCNTGSGHTLDAEAARRHAIERWQDALLRREGAVAGRATVELDGRPVVANVRIADNVVTMVPDKRSNHPDAIAAVTTYLEEQAKVGGGEGMTYRLTPHQRYHPRLAWLSNMRATYLAAFAKLGYTYAFHPRLARVRAQLLEPLKDLRAVVRISTEDRAESPTLAVIEEPCKAIAAHIGREIILLPWPAGPEDAFKAQIGATGRANLTGHRIAWPRGLELVLDGVTTLLTNPGPAPYNSIGRTRDGPAFTSSLPFCALDKELGSTE
jgi:hypothetical protein